MEIVVDGPLSIGEEAPGNTPMISHITVNNPRDLHNSVSLNNS